MEDLVGFDSLHLGVAKESRFVRHRMHFFYSFSFPSLTVLKFKVQDFFLVVWSRKGTYGLDLVSIFPCPFERFLIVLTIRLVFLFLIVHISRSFFLLLMDDLSRAVAQFYPTLGSILHHPNSSPMFAAASHEAEGQPGSSHIAIRGKWVKVKESCCPK